MCGPIPGERNRMPDGVSCDLRMDSWLLLVIVQWELLQHQITLLMGGHSHAIFSCISYDLVGDLRRNKIGVVFLWNSLMRFKKRAIHLIMERPANASGNNRRTVCKEVDLTAKKRNAWGNDKDLPKRCKTVFWCSLCREHLCIRRRRITARLGDT